MNIEEITLYKITCFECKKVVRFSSEDRSPIQGWKEYLYRYGESVSGNYRTLCPECGKTRDGIR